MVDKPEVFTRERLILRRHQDIQWLEEKLSEELKFEFQGLEDVRLLSEMMSKFNAKYDPSQGKIDTATVQNQLNELKLQSLRQELSTLQQQALITEALRKQSEGEKEEESGEQEATEIEDSDQDKLDQIKADLEKKIDTKFNELNEAIKNIAAQTPSTSTSSLFEPQLIKSGARPTGIELLRDQMAYREAIHAALREKELDDTHDLLGNTVYTFKFDISVLPGSNTKSFSKVTLKLNPYGSIPSISDRFFEIWKAQIEKNVQDEALSFQRRWEKGQLAIKEKIELAKELEYQESKLKEELRLIEDYFKDIEVCKTNSNNEEKLTKDLEKLLEKLRSDLKLKRGVLNIPKEKGNRMERLNIYPFLIDHLNNPKDNPIDKPEGNRAIHNDLIKRALCTLTMKKYEKRITHKISLFGYVREIETYFDFYEPNKFYNYYIPETREGFNKHHLKRLLEESVEDQKDIFVYSVEPKEYAQNISDVAALEKMKSLILGLGLVIPGIKMDIGHTQLDKSQQMLQAIKRKPLAVGFINGKNEFGWILGPKFQISEKGTATFTHTPVQYSFQALIAAPAWMEKIELEGDYSWLDNDLAIKGKCKIWKPNILINLPTDTSVITDVVLQSHQQRVPSISKAEDMIFCRANTGTQILVRGRNLWRNPEVFIGSQKATNVSILPDMKGLIVKFDKVEMPPQNKTGESIVDLTVITSQGASTLNDAVTILPEKVDTKSTPVIRYESTSIVKGDFLKVSTSGMISDGLYKVQLRIWPVKEDPKEAIDVEGEVLSSKDKEKVFQFKIGEKNKDFWRNNWDKNPGIAEMKASLVVQFFKNQIPQVIPKDGINGSFIYFENEDNRKVELMSKKLKFSIKNGDIKEINPIKFKIVKKARFYKAFSSLYEALQKTFSLGFESNLSPGSPFYVSIAKTTDYVLEENNEDLIISINALPDESKWEELIKALKNDKITTFKLKLIYSGEKSLTVKDVIKKQRLE